MEDVRAAFLAAERIVAQAHIEDDGVLRLGKIGDGKQVVRLQVGDDRCRGRPQNLLGLGDDIAVDRNDILDELIVLIDEAAASVVVGDAEARALEPVVGQDAVDERKRNGLLVFLGEIVDGDLPDWRRILCGRVLFGAGAEGNEHGEKCGAGER